MHYASKILSILNKEEAGRVRLLVLLMLVGALLEMFSVALVFPLVTLLISPDSIAQDLGWLGKYFVDLLGHLNFGEELILILTLFTFVYLLKTFFLSFQAWFHIKFVYLLQNMLSRDLLRHYLYEPYIFHVNNNSSKLIRNVTTEVNLFSSAVMSITSLMVEVIVFTGLVLVLFTIEPVGLLMILSSLLVIFMIFVFAMKRRLKLWGESRQFNEGMRLKYIIQGLNGYKEYLLLGTTEAVLDEFLYHNSEFVDVVRKQNLYDALPRYWLEFAVVLALMIVVAALSLNNKADIIVPIMAVFAAVALRILPSINRIISFWQTIKFSVPTVDLMYKIMNDIDRDNSFRYDKKNLRRAGDLFLSKMKDNKWNSINIEKLSYCYPDSTVAIDEISFSVHRGDTVGLIGESGSGKSTLSNIITGLIVPSNGCVKVDGYDIQSNMDAWRGSIGYVSQDSILIDDTVRANIALGIQKDKVNNARIEEVIEQSSLGDFISTLGDGIDTVIGEGGARLSGGQRQRIAIARALYNDPSVLIFDESTSALDSETESDIVDQIQYLSSSKTIIIVAHRLSTLKYCDYIYKISKGKLVLQGDYKDVVA